MATAPAIDFDPGPSQLGRAGPSANPNGGQRAFAPGTIAPKEGPAIARQDQWRASAGYGPNEFGPNNEQLEKFKPEVIAALRNLILEYRTEGIVSRRHEIRRIRQARL